MALSRKNLIFIATAVSAPFLAIGLTSVTSFSAASALIILTAALAWLMVETTVGRWSSQSLSLHQIAPKRADTWAIIAMSIFLWLWLVVADLTYTGLIVILAIPVLHASVRGGLRLSLRAALILATMLILFFAVDPNGSREEFVFGFSFSIALIPVAVIAGNAADRLRRAATDLSALYETGRAIGASLRLNEILEMVVNIIYIDTAADLCVIFLKDDATDTLKIEAGRGFESEDAEKAHLRLGEGAVGWVAKYGQSLNIEEFDPAEIDYLASGIHSVISAPMIIDGASVGAVLVGKKQIHAFAAQELEWLDALAGLTANAIRNARAYSQTEEFAIRDGLTGSYNYRYFSGHLSERMIKALSENDSLSLIMIDIDHFKKVNDSYGHLVGDKILMSLARLLERNTRETDIVSRYGGEEFAIILPGARYEDAFKVAAKLRQIVEQAGFLARERETSALKITISLGVATFPTNAASEIDLIDQADRSLYKAKTWRNAVCSPLECESPHIYAQEEQDAGIRNRSNY